MSRDRIAGLIDQGVFSLLSLAQMLVYARLLDAEEFGLFAVTNSVVLVCHAIHWGLVVMPMTVATATQEHLPMRTWTKWNTAVVSAMAAVCLVVAVSPLVAPVRPFAQTVSLVSLAVVPGYLCFEYFRRRLFIVGAHSRAPALIMVWAALQVVGVGIVVFLFRSGIAASLAVAAASGLAALFASRIAMQEGNAAETSIAVLVRTWRGTISSNAAAVLPYLGYNTAMPLLVSSIAGPIAAGTFSATRLFLSPVNTFANAIGTVDKPRAARALRDHGAHGLRRALTASAKSLSVVAVPYAVVVLLFGDWIVAWTLGDRFGTHVDVVRLWVVVGVLVALGHPIETGLIVLDRARHVFWSRLLATILALGVLTGLGRLGAYGAVLAVLVAWLSSLLVATALLAMELRVADSGRHRD